MTGSRGLLATACLAVACGRSDLLTSGAGDRASSLASSAASSGAGTRSGSAADCGPAQAELSVLADDQVAPYYVALDETTVFWAQSANYPGLMMSAPKLGGAVSVLGPAPDSEGIVVDASSVYWAL